MGWVYIIQECSHVESNSDANITELRCNWEGLQQELSGVQWSSVLSWTSWPAVTSACGQGHCEVRAMDVGSVLC
jgi:hypothetical protein